MRTASILMGFLILMLTTGCGTVVYRVNPDSLPRMSVSEARDALELSMSVIKPNMKVSSFVIRDDEMFITSTTLHTFSVNVRNIDKVAYSEIGREVIKLGENFNVNLTMRNIMTTETIMIAWKSKEDAIQFANAAYILHKKGDYKKPPVQTVPVPQVAIAKQVHPAEEPVVKKPPEIEPQVTAHKVARAKSVPEFAPEKDTHVVLDQSPKVQPSTKAQDEKTPPKIFITSPDVTRAVSAVAKKTTTAVTGIAVSDAGIMDIRINGLQADMDEEGRFSIEVPLKVGRNEITVTAIDIHNNKATKKFIISREAGKIVAAKPEAVEPKTGIRSAKYYALLIAVQDYTSGEINKLDHPVSDAKNLMETLVSNYTFEKENVLFLQNPDRKAIYRAFQDLRKRLTEKDNLLVFYAGHGTWMGDMQQGFWLPRDAAGPNDPSDWISNSSVRDYIKSIKSKHILLVADACFSGGIFKVRTAFADPGTSVEKIYELPSRKAITSGSLKTVPDRSVFIDFLVKRLKNNIEPYLDTQKLFASLREAVINNSVTNQTPLYGAINEAGDEGGDFVFVRRQ